MTSMHDEDDSYDQYPYENGELDDKSSHAMNCSNPHEFDISESDDETSVHTVPEHGAVIDVLEEPHEMQLTSAATSPLYEEPPGSTIITSDWPGYKPLGQLPEGYAHLVADPERNITIQKADNLLEQLAMFFDEIQSDCREQFSSILDEFVWRKIPCDDRFAKPVLNTNSQSTTTSLEKYTAPTFLLPAITPLRLLSTIINEIGSSNRKVCEASPVFVELQQNIIKMHTSVAIEAHSFVPNETSFQVTGSIQKVLSARTPGLSSVSSPRTILVKKDNVIDGDGQQYNVVRHYQTFVCIDRMVKTLKAVHIMLHGASPTTWSHPSGFPRARLFQENFGMKKAQEVRSDRVAFSTRIKQRLRKPVGFMHTQVYCPSYESAEKGRCGAFALHGTSLNEKPRCRWLEQRE
ncbi:hypothetical protein X801_04835, partial [Opisthorchis viverrini]